MYTIVLLREIVCACRCGEFTPEQGHGPEEPCTGRGDCPWGVTSTAGPMAWDRSYWQLTLSYESALNISLEWFGGASGLGHDAGQSLSLLATVAAGFHPSSI